MEFISAKEASEKWGISKRRVQLLCNLGRIDGVTRVGNMWLIPKEAKKPKDARYSTNLKESNKVTNI
ncbi:helix-turn-helix domain-containing protein [Clostridium senegalense]|uniref:helix-turn-helix domain-containing protein n=1 Tax=Clostridium senegalense TaxID=1465809 RepID=UPI001C1110AC|nr:helix-turn-helix domain-containing protein [Clostridium senegalense]MBU5227037.1 helix-turn-helix domain-containing protein [Clostridium senegalense]